MGNRLQGHYYMVVRRPERDLPEKTPVEKNMSGNLGRNHGPNSTRLHIQTKEVKKKKKNLALAKGGRLEA